MGLWDNKNMVLHLYTKQDFSDPRLVELTKSNTEFTVHEYIEHVNSISNIWNKYAENLIRFFHTYRDGMLRPDRYNTAEPIREIYEEEKIPVYIKKLSFPASVFYVKKLKGLKYIGAVENEQFGVSWVEDKARGIPKHRFFPICYPIYLGRVLLHFDKRSPMVRRQPLTFWFEIFESIKSIMEADKGYIKDDESGEILYQFGGLQEKDIW